MGKFIHAPVIPADDQWRLEKLQGFKILDTPPEAPFNYIAAQAACLCNTPIAIVSLVDKYRVWYKASVGMDGLQEVPREDSLCSMVILQDAVTVFQDALEDPCLLANPFVAGDFGLRFFAGAPIRTEDGFRLGAVCVIDQKPRSFSAEDQQNLEKLAAQAMQEIKARLCQPVAN